MALEPPLRSSTGNLQFSYSNQSELSSRSDSEGRASPFRIMSSPPPATDSSSLLRPKSVNRVPSNFMSVLSPSDIVGPSPVTSNGTEITEIEDDVSEEVEQDSLFERSSGHSEPLVVTTNLPENVRQPNPDEAVSVIHAPESFTNWRSKSPKSRQKTPSPRSSPKSDEDKRSNGAAFRRHSPDHPQYPPLTTDVKPVRYSVDSATPRAQDLQDVLSESSRLRSSSTSSLEKIEEQTEAEGDDEVDEYDSVSLYPVESDEIASLRTALDKTWDFCHTMFSLSSTHRARIFNDSGTPDAHEKAWKACWNLCQRLYDNLDEDPGAFGVKVGLDLCREFCQALFDVRQRKDELADSVLRVSMELNNHLFSTQDTRNLPEKFNERTLDFYITLCHRLIKQRGELSGETNKLLRSCWFLAEMLFGLRQNRVDGKSQDAELLSSAVQACLELCDIFREGWNQIRPVRHTPRPSQSGFFSHGSSEPSGRESRQSNRSSHYSKSKSSHQESRPRKPPPVPETPVTEFEDTPISPESRSPQMPNLMVLGTTSEGSRGGRWSSSASNLSSYSHSSNRTSSTATTTAANEDQNITRAKILVLKAAMNLGFDREKYGDPKAVPTQLQNFVQTLPAGAFGPNHNALVAQYKNSVLTDAFVPRHQSIPARGKRVSAIEMASSVQSLCNHSARYSYLRDLFEWVFRFPIGDAKLQANVSIAV